jgi:hypothetical protein
LRGADGRRVTARAGADDCDVKCFHNILSLGLMCKTKQKILGAFEITYKDDCQCLLFRHEKRV